MGYIRADHVKVGMVIDLQWPAREADEADEAYAWYVYAVDVHVAVPTAIPLRLVNVRTDRTHAVRLNPNEPVWVTGWGVQPSPEEEVLA